MNFVELQDDKNSKLVTKFHYAVQLATSSLAGLRQVGNQVCDQVCDLYSRIEFSQSRSQTSSRTGSRARSRAIYSVMEFAKFHSITPRQQVTSRSAIN